MALVFFNYELYAYESLILAPLKATFIVNEDEFSLFVRSLVKKKPAAAPKGFAVVGAHYCELETLGRLLTRVLKEEADSTFFVLSKPARSRVATRILAWYRRVQGIELLWTDRKDLFLRLVSACESGESLGYCADQKPSKGGLFIRFFGAFAAFPYSGLDLPIQQGVPLFFALTQRSLPGLMRVRFAGCDNSHAGFERDAADGRERVRARAQVLGLDVPSSLPLDEKQTRVAQVMSCYVAWLEEIVRERPSQWFWDYRKWSRKPSEVAVANERAEVRAVGEQLPSC